MRLRHGDKVVNLTAHTVRIWTRHGVNRAYSLSGGVARVVERRANTGRSVNGAPLYTVELHVEGMPDPGRCVWFIVTDAVRRALPERQDVITPVDFVSARGHYRGFVSNA